MATRLKSDRRSANAMEHALNWLAEGVALLRADGRVVYANAAMQAIAANGDGVRLASGRLEFANTTARDHFNAAFAAAARTGEDPLRGAAQDNFAAPRDNTGLPYLVSVRPLMRAARESHNATEARVIVFVSDPLSRNAAALDTLRQVFGFTPAEANLAQALRSGQSLVDYARKHRLSHNTVYWHLRRIKEKNRLKAPTGTDQPAQRRSSAD